MAFKNRVRLPILFYQPQFPTERNIFRKADGTSKVLSVVVRNTYDGKTDQLPEDWHRKLVIALSHDIVTIENERLLSNVVFNGDYGIDWLDFLQYPIAPANFNVEVTPFNATNSNCQTCEEMSQVSLVDDVTTDIWNEGTTNIFPDVLTDNDTICCYPYVITLVNFNPFYFTSVTISPAGVLTATVIDPAPIVDDVWIAKYRVTCADGNYDEADVYGNITGTDTSFCYPPVEGFSASQISASSVLIDWDVIFPPAPSWNWTLYLTSDLGTAIQSGTTIISEILLTGLNTFVSYTIFVVSDCGGGNLSTPVDFQFQITNFASDTCGNFSIDALEAGEITYMDCAGNIVNQTLAYPQIITQCMLITSGSTTPFYFVSSSPLLAITYVALC